MTFKEICISLDNAGIQNSKNEALIIISYFCGLSQSNILSEKNKSYTEHRLIDAVKKRILHYPLQYILGEWDFYKETYKVNSNCLIPRSDTELLVEKAIKLLPQNAHFLDLCTGSGCIAISVLNQRQDCLATAIDLFPETLALAKENAQLNNVQNQINFFCGDVLKGSPPPQNIKFDAVLSNPPYIKTCDIENLEKELKYEPLAALDGGLDGLAFYRAILKHYLTTLNEKGFLLLEHGAGQGKDITEIAKEYSLTSKQFYDLSGNDRTCLLTRENNQHIIM